MLHPELIWGKEIYFAFLRLHQCSSLDVRVFLGILFSTIREIEVLMSLIGNIEHLSMKCRGIGPHLAARGKSHDFFLELLQAPGVYSQVKSGMSSQNCSLFSEVRTPV